MRMWGINTKELCNQHLLGEHLEMHMFAGCIKKGLSLKGYYENKLVCTNLIKKRHDELADEMISRNTRHNSPMEDIGFLKDIKYGEIDIEANKIELSKRCLECRKRFINK